MFELTQRYLSAHHDAETGETSGNAALLQICMRYQRIRWWWNWHKEQPAVASLPYAISQMARAAIVKATF
jgi:hypothetical protein